MLKDVDYYVNLLKNPAKMEVVSLIEYMNAVIAINSIYKKILFRGQADQDWEIEGVIVLQ